MKWVKKIIKLGKIEVEKRIFHQYKSANSIYDVNIDEIVASSKFSSVKNGFRCFISYKDGEKVKPLCVMLPKMHVNRRDFDGSKYMSFLMKSDGLLQ